MSHKHKILWLVLGWLVAFVFPPQAILSKVKSKG